MKQASVPKLIVRVFNVAMLLVCFFGLVTSSAVNHRLTCDTEKCKTKVTFCMMMGKNEDKDGKTEEVKLMPTCRECNPEVEKKIYNGRCPCCERCYDCMGELFDDCCSCLGMCDLPSHDTNEVHITVLHFQTNEDEGFGRFKEVTDVSIDNLFNVNFDVYHNDKIVENSSNTHHRRAFYNYCMPYSECAINCQSMGAGHTRWFHREMSDKGCCECMDPRMRSSHLNHDGAQPLCSQCNEDKL